MKINNVKIGIWFVIVSLGIWGIWGMYTAFRVSFWTGILTTSIGFFIVGVGILIKELELS